MNSHHVTLVRFTPFKLKDKSRAREYERYRTILYETVDAILKERNAFFQMMDRKESPPDGYWQKEHQLRTKYRQYLRLMYEEFPEAFPPDFKMD